jgi:hypothetical protein
MPREATRLRPFAVQEETRRMRALTNRHAREREEVAVAHARQYTDFNEAWDRYLAEYDAMAGMYVAQLQERHAARLKEFQVKGRGAGGWPPPYRHTHCLPSRYAARPQDTLHEELAAKPVKFSRELLEWRAREHSLAKWVPCLCTSPPPLSSPPTCVRRFCIPLPPHGLRLPPVCSVATNPPPPPPPSLPPWAGSASTRTRSG